MSKNKMGKDLNESKLKKVSGGNITIIDHGKDGKEYIASQGVDNFFEGEVEAPKSFKTLEEAQNYAKEKGWSTSIKEYYRLLGPK